MWVRQSVVVVTAKGRTKPRYRSAVVRGVKTLSESDRRARRRRLSIQNVVFSNAATRKTLYGSESGCAVVVVVAVAVLNPPGQGFGVEIPFVGRLFMAPKRPQNRFVTGRRRRRRLRRAGS